MNTIYKQRNDFDDMNVVHQTKSQFKNLKGHFNKVQKNKRSPFVDCFSNDSIVTPATICPPGVNSTSTFPCVSKSHGNFTNCANSSTSKWKKHSKFSNVHSNAQYQPSSHDGQHRAKSSFTDKFNCPDGMYWNNFTCSQFNNQNENLSNAKGLNEKKKSLLSNRKKSFFNSIVD
jgi:hypothetical protein